MDTEENVTKPLPCPFCGEPARYENSDDGPYEQYVCTGCSAIGGFAHYCDDMDALSNWNKRVAPNVATWEPIESYPEGTRAMFWMSNGESGNGGMEYGIAFRDGDGIIREGWTDGGPNAGSDFTFFEPPTLWCYPPENPLPTDSR